MTVLISLLPVFPVFKRQFQRINQRLAFCGMAGLGGLSRAPLVVVNGRYNVIHLVFGFIRA
jgi:hypothetical protein